MRRIERGYLRVLPVRDGDGRRGRQDDVDVVRVGPQVLESEGVDAGAELREVRCPVVGVDLHVHADVLQRRLQYGRELRAERLVGDGELEAELVSALGEDA